MLRTAIAKSPVVKTVLPVGSRRRAAASNAFRRVQPVLDRFSPPGPKPKSRTAVTTKLAPKTAPKNLRTEEGKLQGNWRQYKQETLSRYLVSGYQDPRINIQSILARHTLVRELFGSEFDALMHEEIVWAVELNNALRLRAAELGVKIKTTTNPERQAEIDRAAEVIADRVDAFRGRWQKALAGRQAPTLSVLELACGSANDYRTFDAYGIARFLDYTGVDLNESNIANARQMFPDINFRVGSVLSLPEADRSVDYVIAFDIMEHLSLAASKHATNSAMRICRRGIYIAYFLMDEIPNHKERPVRNYHRNLISAPRIRRKMANAFETVELIRISDMLRDTYDYPHSHTKRAYSLIAQGPKQAS